eukprot:688974-Amphidinium_carterae.1
MDARWIAAAALTFPALTTAPYAGFENPPANTTPKIRSKFDSTFKSSENWFKEKSGYDKQSDFDSDQKCLHHQKIGQKWQLWGKIRGNLCSFECL